ncbi:hypothetical protein ABE237_22540 [Brevibacillus formosus]|uniref:hypothetical protein n=1 Tax=Brevibacillus formosus TaxID=54913 RepID=UPI0018CCB36E|nr:hypothetical protein [Brevibacillus formosus]MBG9941773.1 hypothetical protein [Brevibacillus formosus]
MGLRELAVRKGTSRHIESELYSYHATKQEIVRLQNGSYPGTALTVSRLLESLLCIVAAIKKVYEALPEEKQRFMRLKFWAGKDQTWDALSAELATHRNILIKWQKEIIFAVAFELGWR